MKVGCYLSLPFFAGVGVNFTKISLIFLTSRRFLALPGGFFCLARYIFSARLQPGVFIPQDLGVFLLIFGS